MSIVELYDEEDLLLCELLDVDTEEGEILEEFATVARSQELKMCVAANPDKNRNLQGMEYFKVYNHIDPMKATHIARIKFCRPEYVIHNRNRGKKNWTLNSHEKKALMKLLESPSVKYKGFTVWQALIIDFNYETGLDPDDTKRNKTGNLLYPGYLPIDLRMPDYYHSAFTVATHDKK